ncbi:hypothetical protein [Streptomyces avermitilis]|uniref:hypothetical protein n=1 Tax=Streptomyces avermitilis TaxID=33903 RepID=UPI0033B0523E
MVEALWDGDTFHDWFVLLVAVLDDPAGEGRLATVHHRVGGPRRAPAPPRRAGPWPTTSGCRSTSPPRTSPTTRPRDGGRPGRASGQGHR